MENQSRENVIVKRILCIVVALVIAAAAFIAGFFTHKITRGKELSSYEWLLKTIGENYYWDFDNAEAGELSLKAIASKLDPYSEYYTAEEYAAMQNENAGAKSGVGISYNFVEGEGARIITVVGSSPAFASGMRPGVLITGGIVDGEEKTFTASKEFSEFIGGFDTGEEFILCSSSGKRYSMSKSFYKASYTAMYTKNMEYVYELESPERFALKTNISDKMDFLPENAAYIKLNQFYGTAADEFGVLLQNFNAQNCSSLILDLRNNGGGYVSVMSDIAGYFTSSVKSETCVSMIAEYKNGKQEKDYCVKHSGASLFPAGTNLYVLANSGTASASEALIGVLISYGILKYENVFISDFSQKYLDFMAIGGGEVKTARTYGKGIMQATFQNFITKEAVKLTTAKIYWPDGKCIHDVGLTESDGCRLSPAEWSATENDEELRFVIDSIK